MSDAMLFYVLLFIIAVLVLLLVRVMWSTNFRRLHELQATLRDAHDLELKRGKEVDQLRRAENILRQAVRKLEETIRIRDTEIAQHQAEILTLKHALEKQRRANERLNEIIGSQEQVIDVMRNDIARLKNEILKLNAQLGLLP